MDPPYLQHPPRYAPFSSPHPENPSFYGPHTPHHHHHHRLAQPQQPLPPPPPPPQQQQQQQQQQQSFHPPLPPPPPQQQQQQQQNPYQPQFHLNNPIEENHHTRSHQNQNQNQIQNFPHSPRLSHRSLFNDDHRPPPPPPRLPANHHLWDPSRPHHAVNLDHRQFDQRPGLPYRSIDKFRHDLESSPRFREEIQLLRSRGSGGGGGDENYQRQRFHFGSDSDRSSRDIGTVPFSRGFESNSGPFDNRYDSKFDGDLIRSNGREGVSENQRWSHNRDGLRDARDSLIEMRNDQIVGGGGGGDGVRVLSAKREYYGSDLGRYGNRGSREGSHEYNRTPRKQIQKKSALLRLQKVKPSYRNREDERLHYSGYFDESKSSGFGGKDKILEEVEREGSPVDLDVSFKSNSLVAKAVVTPLSSRVVSDVKSIPRNSKIRKVLLSDKECSSSRVSKLDEGSVKLHSSAHVVNNASSSDKDSKHSGEKVTSFGIGNVGDSSSQQCSNATKVLTGKRKLEGSTKGTVSNKGGSNFGSGTKGLVLHKGDGNVGSTIKGTVSDKGGSNIGSGTKGTTKGTVSDKGGSNVGSGNTSSVKVAKKKKVVKKVVKKVINPRSQLSSSLPTKKHDEPLKAESSACSIPAPTESDKGVKPLEEKIATTGITPVSGVDSQPCPNEINVSAENGKVDGSPQTMVSGEVGSDVDSGGSCVPKINRKRKKLSSPLGSSSLKETKIDEGFVNPDNRVHGLHTISNTGKYLTKSLSETTISDVGGIENVSKQCCENGDSILLKNVGATESLEVSVGGNNNSGLLSSEENKLVNTCSCTHSTDNATGNDSINLQESFTVSDIGTVDAAGKQPCTNQAGSSSLEETRICSSPINADCSNNDRGIMLGTDNVCANLEKINHGTGDDIGKQTSADGVTISLENGAIDGSPNTMVSVGDIGDNTPKNKNKRKIRTSQLDLSSSMITDMCLGPVNVVSSAHCVDTTFSLSVKDPCFSEARDAGFGNLYVGLHPCVDEVSVLDRSSSEMKVSVSSGVNVGLNGTSPENKRRKVSASHSGLSSPTASVINEGPVIADISTSGVELPTNSNDALVQPEEEVTVSSMDTLCTAGLPPCPERITASLENSSAGGSFEAVVSVRDAYMDDGLKTDLPVVDSCSVLGESAIPSKLSLCPSGLVVEQIARATPVTVGNNHQNYLTDMDSGNREKMDVDAAEDQVMIPSKTAEHRIPSEHQSPDVDERLPGTDVEYDGCPLEKDGFPSVSNYLALSADGDGVSTTNSNDELEFAPDTLSDMGSPETLSDAPGIRTLNCNASLGQISHEKDCGNDKIPDEKIVIEGSSNLSAHTSDSQTTNINLKFDHAMESENSVPKKTGPVASQDSKTSTRTQNPTSGEINGRKNQQSHAVPKVYQSRSSVAFNASKNTVSSSSTTIARTWHRTGNSSATTLPGNQAISNNVHTQRPLPNKVTKFQSTSYIRKGNSLVRKPAPVAALPQGSHTLSSSVYRLNSSGVDEVKKSTGSNSRADVTEQPSFLRTGVLASFERPRTPPLTSVTKVPNRATNSSGDCTTSPLAEPRSNGSCENTSDPMKVSETNDKPNSSEDALKISEIPVNQTGSVSNLESQSELNHGNLDCSNVQRITYVKRKSNQLIATSNPCALSVHEANKNNSDSYYKRRKNQLIRTSLESHIKQTGTMPDDASNTEGQTAPKLISSRSFSAKRSHKVVSKTRNPSKFSLVWTLRSTQLSRDVGNSLHHQVLPHLVPWKRATYWRSFMQNLASMSNSNSSSTISRKLLLLRKRDTVYTRSAHGFSLRKSKVLSVGGSSLKWSKSIERNSKNANEEATLAVAAAQRKKREQNSAGCIFSGTKNRNHSSRERVFRVGSVRYKMDSSRRTLQRISDDESSCSAAPPSENNAKKSYVPRRLVIGNDEYVRIGNGNQLIRDPKKRSRVLASEKVRWSLHTARLRLARKRKYCQFFTRFGKCNKDDGKCPYIHDPSKIAVCTKFLNGLCFNPSCKLTHQVIPERMPDCSYFLQGLCTNKNCSYRHVHVNPNASTCEGFLRGYCADGNECRKKHSYVCPIFEATGSCPQGSKCKLHHPKNRSKGKKTKRSREQKKPRARYFGSMHVNVSEPGTAVLEKDSVLNNGDIISEGGIADYISLDDSNEEAGESNDPASEQTSFCESDPSDLQLDDLDELIKPIRIMHMNLMT